MSGDRRVSFWTVADWVVEVVSAGAKRRRRDLEEKRLEYAVTGIAEYWIVDPLTKTISVLELKQAEYTVAGEFGLGQHADSRSRLRRFLVLGWTLGLLVTAYTFVRNGVNVVRWPSQAVEFRNPTAWEGHRTDKSQKDSSNSSKPHSR